MNQYPDIIPFDKWINSQLSIAKYSWAITLNGKTYVVDYVFAEEWKDWLCYPNLVEQKLHLQTMRDNPGKVAAFKAEWERQKKEESNNNIIEF